MPLIPGCCAGSENGTVADSVSAEVGVMCDRGTEALADEQVSTLSDELGQGPIWTRRWALQSNKEVTLKQLMNKLVNGSAGSLLNKQLTGACTRAHAHTKHVFVHRNQQTNLHSSHRHEC